MAATPPGRHRLPAPDKAVPISVRTGAPVPVTSPVSSLSKYSGGVAAAPRRGQRPLTAWPPPQAHARSVSELLPPSPRAPGAPVRYPTNGVGEAMEQTGSAVSPSGCMAERPGRRQLRARSRNQLTMVPSVAARSSSSVTPSAHSTIFRPPSTTSRTPRLVMIRSTTPVPVSGRVQDLSSLDSPALLV